MRITYRMAKVFMHLWIDEPTINGWAKNKRIFFILGMGRSGTKFLARLLDEAPESYVVHEPVWEDFPAYVDAFYSQKKAQWYIKYFRKKEIFLRVRDIPCEIYGESNGVLRRHLLPLKKAFPHAIFFHLIRDGRDVVRSLMARHTMTPKDPITSKIHPLPDDPWYERWEKMDRFEKICWYWQVENKYLREQGEKCM